MKKRLTLGWIVVGLGISAIAFSSPVTSLEDLQTHSSVSANNLPITSLLIPQTVPIPRTNSGLKHSHYQSWGLSGDLILTGCAIVSLWFARKYHLRLLSEQD